MIYIEQDDKVYTIDIPTIDEIKFSDWCDFRTSEARYMDQDITPAEANQNLKESLKHIIRGNLDILPAYVKGDETAKLIENGYYLKIGDEVSVMRIYAHLVTMIQAYMPDKIPHTFRLRWGGKKFTIQKQPIARVLLGRPMTTGEALEVLEYQRRASASMETTPKDIGNIDFNLGLREIAILLRKQGEELPAERTERIRFINSRMELFKDIPLRTILDLRFFFALSLMSYTTTKTILSSGKDHQVVTTRLKQIVNGYKKN